MNSFYLIFTTTTPNFTDIIPNICSISVKKTPFPNCKMTSSIDSYRHTESNGMHKSIFTILALRTL